MGGLCRMSAERGMKSAEEMIDGVSRKASSSSSSASFGMRG